MYLQISSTTHALRPRNVSLYLAATFITNLGNGIQTITAAFVTLKQTGSTMSVGLLFVLLAAPQILISLVAGKLADRKNKKWICIVCDLQRAFLVTILAVA